MNSRKVSEEERQAAFEFLNQRYPKAFRYTDLQPLEVDITHKLMVELKDVLPEVGIRRRAIYAALGYYFYSDEYKAVRKVQGTPRINLQGEPAGEVTEGHIGIAKAIHKAKKKRQRQRKGIQKALERQRLEKQQRLAEMEARKAAKQARREEAMRQRAEAAKRKEEKLKEESLRKSERRAPPRPKQGTTQAKVTVKPIIKIKSKKVLSLPKKDKDEPPDK